MNKDKMWEKLYDNLERLVKYGREEGFEYKYNSEKRGMYLAYKTIFEMMEYENKIMYEEITGGCDNE